MLHEQRIALFLSDLAGELIAEEERAREAARTGKALGSQTGFESFDKAIGGFFTPGLHTLLAAPGAGKTALALQIGEQCGTPCLYVTAEMRPVDLLRRIAARISGQYLGQFRGGGLLPSTLEKILLRVAEACPKMALYDGTMSPISPDDICRQAAAIRDRFGAEQCLVIIDSFSDWAGSLKAPGDGGRMLTEYEACELGISALKTVAGELSSPILAIVHRNRAGNNRSESAEQLHSVKGSGRLEYVPETVMNLSVDNEASASDIKNVTLTFSKNRNGIRGQKIAFTFEGRLQKFTEV